MRITEPPPDAGQFRPVSIPDFQNYAKALAWLAELPLQRAQELLARIYGYSGLHELQQIMKSPGIPGPFTHIWDEDAVLSSEVGAQLYFQDPEVGSKRLYREWDLLGAEKGLDRLTLTPRLERISDLLLFDPPDKHRAAFRLLRSTIDVLDGRETDGNDRLPSEYAYVEEERGYAVLTFTDLGRSIYNALRELIPDAAGRALSRLEPEECAMRMQDIADRHPNNPWPFAVFLTTFANVYYQTSWADNIHNYKTDGFRYDPDPGYAEHQSSNARVFLLQVKRTVALFEELFGDKLPNAAPHDAYVGDRDAYTWPALLYYGALVALNAGDEKLAKKWFTRNRKLTEQDNFGSRYYLATIALNQGRPAIKKFFKSPDVWGKLALAAEAAREGDLNLARDYFGRAAVNTWATLEVFSGTWPEARKCLVTSNHDSPVYLLEFMSRTKSFWNGHPEVHTFFMQLANDKRLREAVLAFHQLNSERFKRGRRGEFSKDSLADEVERSRREEAVLTAVKEAVLMRK